MPYTPVIPTSYQTDRADLTAALTALIDAFIASESYAVGRVFWPEIPDNLAGEGPIIALGEVTETVQHTMQLRITTFTGELWYIDWITERSELKARVDRWADRMRDLLTYNPQITGKGELREITITEGTRRQGTLEFDAPTLRFEYVVQEGYR